MWLFVIILFYSTVYAYFLFFWMELAFFKFWFNFQFTAFQGVMSLKIHTSSSSLEVPFLPGQGQLSLYFMGTWMKGLVFIPGSVWKIHICILMDIGVRPALLIMLLRYFSWSLFLAHVWKTGESHTLRALCLYYEIVQLTLLWSVCFCTVILSIKCLFLSFCFAVP